MIVGPEDWQQLWDVIDDEFSQSAEKGLAVIFSVQEVETVCAIKMLQLALRVRDVHFSTYPVEDYTQLRSTLSTLLSGSDELRTVFLINCGAGAFVRDFVPASASNVRYVVVDSHRPVHPKYNDKNDMDCFLFLAPDDPQQLHEIPEKDDCDDITEEERAYLKDLVEQEDQEEDETSDRDSSPSPAKRRKTEKQENRERWRMLRQRDKVVREYLDMGSSYGKPTPLVLQPLAEALIGKLDNTVLWPACVGLTDQWVHQRLSNQHYNTWYSQLKEAVKSCDTNQAHANQANNNGKVTSGMPAIAAERDYKLFLPRHWSLFDSFLYSPYVSPRLQTWRRAGEDSIALVLAHMGISKEQAQTPWGSMQRSAHTHFRDGLQKAVESSMLVYNELATEGFVMHHNRQTTAASDVVHAVTALLSEHTLHEVQGDRQTATAFWHAMEAVDVSSVGGFKHLQRGIEMAKAMQMAIIKDGGIMTIDRKLSLNSLAHIWELLLHNCAPTNAREFRHPLPLLRLAQFVKESTKFARQARGLRTPHYPILVVGPEDHKGYCLAIGLRFAQLQDKPQYNVFGRTFKAVLEEHGIDLNWDTNRETFDSAVIYIHKDSVKNFVWEVRKTLKTAADEAGAATQQQQTQQQQQPTQPEQQQQQRSRSATNSGSIGLPEQGDHGEVGQDSDADESLAATEGDNADGADDMAGVDMIGASDDEGQGDAADDVEDDM